MKSDTVQHRCDGMSIMQKATIIMMAALMLFPFNVFSVSAPRLPSQDPVDPASELPDTINVAPDHGMPEEVVLDEIETHHDRVKFVPIDTVPVVKEEKFDRFAEEWVERPVAYNVDPTKAVWMSALFPGLGQIYNRRYWKLPLIVGGYLGLGYATSWNNTMLSDYTKAYADIMDNDPSTKSYMDFFPSTVKEEDLDHQWLTNVLQSRKNYFRRNRDLCIICMVGVYLLAMVDAYVDASLSHFDISPDLSMDVYPALIQDGRNRFPSAGLQWTVNF